MVFVHDWLHQGEGRIRQAQSEHRDPGGAAAQGEGGHRARFLTRGGGQGRGWHGFEVSERGGGPVGKSHTAGSTI